jgi:hypothetical protein
MAIRPRFQKIQISFDKQNIAPYLGLVFSGVFLPNRISKLFGLSFISLQRVGLPSEYRNQNRGFRFAFSELFSVLSILVRKRRAVFVLCFFIQRSQSSYSGAALWFVVAAIRFRVGLHVPFFVEVDG